VIGTVLDRTLHESGCQFCGACVDVCPTGALTERAIKYEPLPDDTRKTICAFCSTGCGMDVNLNKDRILNIQPSDSGAVNKGQACVRGRFLTKDVVYSSRRVQQPMIRRKKTLEEVSWEEALDFVAEKIKSFKGNEIGFIHSPQISCEDLFVASRFSREVLKTKNVAVTAGVSPLDSLFQLAQKNGIKMPFNFKKGDIALADVLFLTGTELALSHPVLWVEVLNAVRNGTKLVIAGSKEQVGNRHASLWLPVKQGAEDLLFQYLSKWILREGDGKGESLEGYPSFRRALNKMDLSKAAEETGVDEKSLTQAVKLLMHGRSCFVAGAELTHFSRENRNMAALWNLSLLCDAQLILLGAENNSRGVFELKRSQPHKMRLWPEIIQDTRKGQLKALYVIGAVPFEKKMKTEFMVLQDSFMNGIAENADAILPATTFTESDGTTVNAEGRIQGFHRIIPPLCEAKPDWWILSQLAKKLGKKNFAYRKSMDILKELKKTVSSFSKISPAGVEKGKTPYVDGGEREGKRKFLPLLPRGPIPGSDKKFPFSLLAENSADYYRNFGFSREIKGFELIRDSQWVKLNPKDAKSLKLKDGDPVLVESPVGRFEGIAKVTGAVPRRTVGASFFWGTDLGIPASPLQVKVKRGK
jgi:predicted molibdopterin-dependent oxidoreductase YjgC